MMDNSTKRQLLGIIGGLGPMSSAYFYELITEHTKAQKDQDHIDIILSSHATTPDRTDFILGRSSDSPLPAMVSDAKSLEVYGATAIVIPCNTAHYFIDEVRKSVSVPVPSIIEETVKHLKVSGRKKACILATEGTVHSGSYQHALERAGLEWAVPDSDGQAELMEIIYGCIKKGVMPPASRIFDVSRPLFESGCDCAILGCTELSLFKRHSEIASDIRFVDSLEVLANVSIKLMNHETCGFTADFNY